MSKYFFFIFVFGITTSVISQNNYYWYGGSGNWSSHESWRLASGVIPNQIPDEFDNVIFDGEAFLNPYDTVYVDVEYPTCRNMTWRNLNSPVVFSSNNQSVLMIYGSLKFHTNLINKFRGEIHFSSIPGDKVAANKLENSDTITSAGTVYLNHMRLIGVGDDIVLADDLEFFYDEYSFQDLSSYIYLINGGINLNGNKLTCGRFLSTGNNERIINIENSEIILKNEDQNVWKVNGENLGLNAYGSSIYLTNFSANMLTENGGTGTVLQYHNVALDSIDCSLSNTNCTVSYNNVFLNSSYCTLEGNYKSDSVYLSGVSSKIEDNSEINFVQVENSSCKIQGEHIINKCIVNTGSLTIQGNNHIKYCLYNSMGEFRGENVFDTLLLFSGSGNSNGVTYTFESESTQIVTDSLNLSGNPCSNITIKSTLPGNEAFIRKDNGSNLVCDFLFLQEVGVLSENINFYAGENSSSTPSPPTGWIMENAPGYSYGWGSQLAEACLGEPYLITTENFLGDPWTQYYWNGEAIPGDNYLEVYESGEYQVRVVYNPTCYQTDYTIVEFDSCENYIAEKDLSKLFQIYPNPTDGPITIESVMISEISSISIYDLNGVIRQQEITKPVGTYISKRINLANLQPGIYYIEIKNSQGNAMQKLIVY